MKHVFLIILMIIISSWFLGRQVEVSSKSYSIQDEIRKLHLSAEVEEVFQNPWTRR